MNIQYRIEELEEKANKARGLSDLSRINHELDNLRNSADDYYELRELEVNVPEWDW